MECKGLVCHTSFDSNKVWTILCNRGNNGDQFSCASSVRMQTMHISFTSELMIWKGKKLKGTSK